MEHKKYVYDALFHDIYFSFFPWQFISPYTFFFFLKIYFLEFLLYYRTVIRQEAEWERERGGIRTPEAQRRYMLRLLALTSLHLLTK